MKQKNQNPQKRETTSASPQTPVRSSWRERDQGYAWTTGDRAETVNEATAKSSHLMSPSREWESTKSAFPKYAEMTGCGRTCQLVEVRWHLAVTESGKAPGQIRKCDVAPESFPGIWQSHGRGVRIFFNFWLMASSQRFLSQKFSQEWTLLRWTRKVPQLVTSCPHLPHS